MPGKAEGSLLPGPAEAATVFFALGDETRLRVLAMLCAGGMFSISQLTATTDISRQAVTKHLQVLADAGLVTDLRIGRERLWQFEPARLADARNLLDVIGSQWTDALGRLKLAVEGEQPPGR
jgi:DNA-binding transcriptional ArsR family regulator